MKFELDQNRVLLPPRNVGMKKLDKAAFRHDIALFALEILACDSAKYLKSLAPVLFSWARLKRLVPHPEHSEKRLLLLCPTAVTSADPDKLPEILRDLVAEKRVSIVSHSLTVSYDYWNAEEILSAVLGDDLPFSCSFEAIGHIGTLSKHAVARIIRAAHLNLRDEFLEYKEIIGQVIHDKNPAIRTVITKVGTIETVFRTFQMEILAGDDDFSCEVKENNCRFRFDFSKVYWNSRLSTEHTRLLSSFKPNEVICDVMAGVGPFAVPAAKRGCRVYANDLNPDSFESINANVKLNKISQEQIKTYNLDGRDFITKMIRDELKGTRIDHFIMNLPAIALEFLDAFRSSFCGMESSSEMPMIHCHCFSKAENAVEDVVSRAKQHLSYDGDFEQLAVHHVRKVAPNKDMYCITFKLPRQVAFEGEGKRRKVDHL